MLSRQTDRNSDPAILILVSLLQKPKHGYSISQDIERNFNVSLGYGTLYGALKRLEKQDLIRVCPPSSRRRPYELTEEGRELIKNEIKGLITLSLIGYKRLKAKS